ncbi:MAG: sigma-70 family RNA polymerase sigma factor [Bacteroidia bacterium]|nr:sigma-70 family RNA polymerase sigma factor [Bacteroidia bacterium]
MSTEYPKNLDDPTIISRIKDGDDSLIEMLYLKIIPALLVELKKEETVKRLLKDALLQVRNLIVKGKFKPTLGSSLEEHIFNLCCVRFEKEQEELTLDHKIINSLLSNDGWGYYYINMQYAHSIKNFVRINSGNTQDAEDLIQDAILVLLNNTRDGKYKPRHDVSVKTYFYAICKNLWLERIRKRKNNPFEYLYDLPEEANEFVDIEFQEELLNERQQLVQELFEQASDACKKVLSLFYKHQLSHEEIAQRLGYANSETSKTQKNKCLSKLKKAIQQRLPNTRSTMDN